MKKLSLLALLLVVALLPLGIFGCAKQNKVTYNFVVTVEDPDDAENPLIDELALTVEVKANYTPTILDAVREACQKSNIEFSASEDGLSIVAIGSLTEKDEDATDESGKEGVNSSFFEYAINGDAVTSGRAGNTTVNDGDSIVCSFNTYFFPKN